MAGLVRSGDHGPKASRGQQRGDVAEGESEVKKWSLYLGDDVNSRHAQQEGVQWSIALPSGSGLSRDLSDPCNPLLNYAQKPRTEAKEKSCASHCRAKEADR